MAKRSTKSVKSVPVASESVAVFREKMEAVIVPVKDAKALLAGLGLTRLSKSIRRLDKLASAAESIRDVTIKHLVVSEKSAERAASRKARLQAQIAKAEAALKTL